MTPDVRYPELWGHYVAYVRAALAIVRKKVGVGERRVEVGVWADLFEPLQKLPEFGSLHEFIASSPFADRVFVDAGSKPIAQAEPQSRWLMNFYVMPILTRYVGREVVLDFDEARAAVVYADLEATLEYTETIYSVVAPLQQFQATDQEIAVHSTLVLRKLTQDEKERLSYLGEFGGIVDRSEIAGMEFCLAFSLATERGTLTKSSEVLDPVLRAVTALRLLKSGQVGAPIVIQRRLKPAFGLPGGTVGTSGAPAALGPSYTLLLEDSEPLVAMCQALAQAGASKTLPVALRRFNQAYQRDRPDDSLIDYWIALEALFLPDDPPQELRYRASLRVAWFVAQSPREREEIFRQIRDSYDARSAIVHGREPKDVRNIAQFTEDVLRRALRKAVTVPGSLDTRELDELIVRGSSYVESADDSLDPPA